MACVLGAKPARSETLLQAGTNVGAEESDRAVVNRIGDVDRIGRVFRADQTHTAACAAIMRSISRSSSLSVAGSDRCLYAGERNLAGTADVENAKRHGIILLI